ncbi:MAG: hypothetical protein WA087_01825 [Candidatus Saccharimonadales bacterium]
MEEKDITIDENSNGNESQKIDVINVSKIEERSDKDMAASDTAKSYADRPNMPQPVADKKAFPGEVKEKEALVDDKKKPKNKNFFISVLVIIVVWLFFAAAGGAYIWRDNQAKNTEAEKDSRIASLQASLREANDKLATNTTDTDTGACTVKSPSVSAAENIKASITSANTAPLEGYMASSVTTVLAASEEGGTYNKTQAVSNITAFIADATSPWDFELTASVLGSYGKGYYAQYFPGSAIVGKSANNKVISFSFDCDGKIKTVFMSASEDILK